MVWEGKLLEYAISCGKTQICKEHTINQKECKFLDYLFVLVRNSTDSWINSFFSNCTTKSSNNIEGTLPSRDLNNKLVSDH